MSTIIYEHTHIGGDRMTASVTGDVPTRAVDEGRRARNTRRTRARIVEAAAELFRLHGFDGVTTQEVSRRADIATGTLFRYASSKGELFLLVFNEELERALDEGERAAADQDDVTDAVTALVSSVLVGAGRTANSADYQRELLFGGPGQPHREAGLRLVERLEQRVAQRLLSAADPAAARQVHVVLAAERAARSVFAVLNLQLVQPQTGAHPDRDPGLELREQIGQIVTGFLVMAVPGTTRPDARSSRDSSDHLESE